MKRNSFMPNSSQSTMLAVMYILFGLVVAFFTTNILRVFVRIFGIALMVYGVWQIYLYMRRFPGVISYLLMGGAGLLVGLIFAISPNTLIGFIPSLIGFVMILNGAIQVSRALDLKRAGFGNWSWSMITAIVLIILGVLLWVRPISALDIVFKAAGFFLVAEGIVMLLDQNQYNKYLG